MIAKFFYIEGAYLILSVVILLITWYVTTRPFMSKDAPKKGLTAVGAFLTAAVMAHYWVTTERMEEVREAFNRGEPVICENRVIRKGAQSLIIRKALGWRLEGDYFVSDNYVRPFFTARCVLYK